MDTTQRGLIMQRWTVVQMELIPGLGAEVGCMTPKLEKLIHILDWIRIEEFVGSTWCGVGRRPHDRWALANAFIAKAVLGLSTTVALIDRLSNDKALRRICGFQMWKQLPDEATFSRAFAEFAESKLAERVQESLVKEYLGDALIGHISRDGTAIEAREKPATPKSARESAGKDEQAMTLPLFVGTEEQVTESTSGGVENCVFGKSDQGALAEQCETTLEARESLEIVSSAVDLKVEKEMVATPPSSPKAERSETKATGEKAGKPKRGRPKKDEIREPKLTQIERQLTQTLPQMLAELPTQCDRGTKCNSQGYKVSWNGYKLHIDTADCGVPISALLTSASTHDSQAAMPLALMTADRVTSCYDLMDAAYCSEVIRNHSRSLGHVPLIDHNPRRGEKKPFEPHEAERYKERTQAERTNGRLKDEFGGKNIWVRGPIKVMSHLMFGMLVLTADKLMRLFI